jgi:putative ABC transport system permease protein
MNARTLLAPACLAAVAPGDIPDSQVLVRCRVFDPPPSGQAVPWGYLGALVALSLMAVGAAGTVTLRRLRRPAIEERKDP